MMLSFLLSYTQKSKEKVGPPPPPPARYSKKDLQNHNCVRYSNESFESLLEKYPVFKSGKVQLISFAPQRDNQGDIQMSYNGIPIFNDTLNYSTLEEVKTLSHSQIDTLTDILYNYGFKGQISIVWESMCFIPRNAIVFLDSDNKVVAYISLCFECQRVVWSTEKLDFDLCEQKVYMIRDFFKKAGIEYGISKGTLFQAD